MLGRLTVTQRLMVASVVSYAGGFALMLAFGKPHRGLGNVFYLPITFASLAAGPYTGAAAGVLGIVLYVVGRTLHMHASLSSSLSLSTWIRAACFVAAGTTIGFFASRARQMMGDALHVLDELLVLAQRDLDTGTLNGQGFESAVNRRLTGGKPFGLLVGEVNGGPLSDGALRTAAAQLQECLEPGEELARVGPAQFAVLVSGEVREAGQRMERGLDSATFGWAMHPQEGSDVLTLFRTAAERLYARKHVRGEWQPTAASAGLVLELEPVRRAAGA